MKNLKSVSKPIYGLESLPNQIDVATLFEVKGGDGVKICIGSKSLATECSSENSGVKCQSGAIVICTSDALGNRPSHPTECLGESDAKKN